MDAPAPAPLIKSVTFQTAQHATMAANIFAKKDQLGLRKLQLSFRLRRDKRLTEIAHAKKPPTPLRENNWRGAVLRSLVWNLMIPNASVPSSRSPMKW